MYNERYEYLLLLICSYLFAYFMMSGYSIGIIVLLCIAALTKLNPLNPGEIILYSFIGALLAFIPVMSFVHNYSSYLPIFVVGYKTTNIVSICVLITIIFLGVSSHYPGISKIFHILVEICLILAVSVVVAFLLYVYGFNDIFIISGTTFVAIELISLAIDFYKWSKVEKLLESYLKEI